MFTLEELLAIEEKFKRNKDVIFNDTWRGPCYNIVMDLIRQLKSHIDISYCVKLEDKEDEEDSI